jgi:uncharacterized membrane protein YeaQ/YmgE (transglycosylase-associated protein family)
LISGAVGGNAAGVLNKARNLGPLLNTVLGALGGVGGGQLLGGALTGVLGNQTGANVASSAVIGALVPLVVGFFKQKQA